MNYDIIDETIPKNEQLNKWFIPFAIMLFLALPLSFLLASNILVILLFLSFAIGFVGISFDSKPVHNINTVIGQIHINEESLSIKYGQTILVNDIKSISIQSNGYEGMPYTGSNEDRLSGITELRITDKLNDVITIRFIIKRSAQFDYFKEVVRTYYIMKISIKESFHYKMKSLLLEPLKSYAETQALKKELGI